MMRKKQKTKTTNLQTIKSSRTDQALTLAEHLQELRRRVMWIVLFIVIGAVAGYFMHDALVSAMQRPLNDNLYYTAPTGAFSFIIKVCTVFGLVAAMPVILYQIFAFFGPLIVRRTKRSLVFYVTGSFLLAAAGAAFAYFLSLPAALHFLVNFGGNNIHSLITANEYFNFVLVYVTGFALIFQLPLVISFINRISPLGPMKMLKATRYVVLGSFIAAAVITPTPDPLNQFMMAAPIISLYLLSVAVVALKRWVDSGDDADEGMVYASADRARLVGDFIMPMVVHTVRVNLPKRAGGLISDFYNPAALGR